MFHDLTVLKTFMAAILLAIMGHEYTNGLWAHFYFPGSTKCKLVANLFTDSTSKNLSQTDGAQNELKFKLH